MTSPAPSSPSPHDHASPKTTTLAPDNSLATIDISTPAPNATAPKTKKQAPNWLPHEEEQLALSWLHVSQDAEVGTYQTGKDFFAKVTNHFNQHSQTYQREAAQIQTRWHSLNTATLKFLAIYNQIQRNPPSGRAPSDYVMLAKREYAAQSKGVEFRLDAAWEVLRYAPKWALEGNPKSETSELRLPASSTPAVISSPSAEPADLPCSAPRPLGAKKAKREREEKESVLALEEAKLKAVGQANDLSARRLKAMEEANAINQEQNDLDLLMKSEADCPDDASRDILRLMKARLHKKYEADL